MASKAYQKIYTRLEAITKATVSLRAKGVSNDELATVSGRLAQVVRTKGDMVTLQVFAGTEGIPTDSEVTFLGEPPTLKVSDQLSGRFFNAYGDPIDGGPEIDGEIRQIGGPSVNPYKRRQPSELIPTGIAGIDLNNTIVSGQKIPFFADPDQPYNQVMHSAQTSIRLFSEAWVLPMTTISSSAMLSKVQARSRRLSALSTQRRTRRSKGFLSLIWPSPLPSILPLTK